MSFVADLRDAIQAMKDMQLVVPFFRNLYVVLIYLVDCNGLSCDDKFSCGCRKQPNITHPNTTCIDYAWVCDGVADCDDGSDEIDCICAENEFQCSTCERGIECEEWIEFGTGLSRYAFTIFYCIPHTKVLDNKIDCYNEKDEEKSE